MKARLEMTMTIEEIADNTYLAVCNEVHSVFAGQVMFEFRLCCGHPALTKEYFLELDMGQWTSKKCDVQVVVSPTRMAQSELDNLRMAAAETVLEFVEYHLTSKVINPSDKVKKAMKNLIAIAEEGPSSMGSQIPGHLRGLMVERCDEMLLTMRAARNAHTADKIADIVLDTLSHYDLLREEPDVRKSFLN